MTLLLAAAGGFLAARLLWTSLRQVFTAPLFLRTNVRGALVPVAAGIVLPLAALAVEAVRATAGAADAGGRGTTPERLAVVIAVLGFALLGLFDDLAGGSEQRGFRGHLGALRSGRLTTGMVKLLGGACVAIVAVQLADSEAFLSVRRLLADAALVALCANLANLLDRAPGRVTKVAVLAFAAVAVATRARTSISGSAAVVGASLGTLLDDLHERLMLGDTGANVLGAVVGLAVVVACGPGTRFLVLGSVLTLNLASEVVSFSAVIAKVPPLRAFDRLGRLP